MTSPDRGSWFQAYADSLIESMREHQKRNAVTPRDRFMVHTFTLRLNARRWWRSLGWFEQVMVAGILWTTFWVTVLAVGYPWLERWVTS